MILALAEIEIGIILSKTWNTISAGSRGFAVRLIFGPHTASVAAIRSIRFRNWTVLPTTPSGAIAGAS